MMTPWNSVLNKKGKELTYFNMEYKYLTVIPIQYGCGQMYLLLMSPTSWQEPFILLSDNTHAK